MDDDFIDWGLLTCMEEPKVVMKVFGAQQPTLLDLRGPSNKSGSFVRLVRKSCSNPLCPPGTFTP